MTDWPELTLAAADRDAEDGVIPCRSTSCRARTRWAYSVHNNRMLIDADPVPDGNLVWTRVSPGSWRMRYLRDGEHPQPPDDTSGRRWKAHQATCLDKSWSKRTGGRAAELARQKAGLALLVNAELDPEEVPQPRRRDHLHVVPDALPVTRNRPLPPLAELGADQDTEERTCRACGTVCPVVLPHLSGSEMVLVDRTGGLYNLLAVYVDDRWRVRNVGPLTVGGSPRRGQSVAHHPDEEQGLPITHRVRRHFCADYSHRCITPGHGDRPARRVSTGDPFCDPCRDRPAAAPNPGESTP